MHVPNPAVLLAAVLAIMGFITGPFEYRLFRTNLSTRSKLCAYTGLMLLLWVLTVAAIGIFGWPLLSNSPAAAATWLPAPRIVGVVIGVVVAVYFFLALQPLVGSLRGVRWRRAYAAAIRKEGAAFAGVLPNGALECAVFALVSLTAGICEEVLFRGFLIRFLNQSPLNLSLVGALGVSCLIFGLNHAYQGAKNVALTTVTGLALGLVFLLTGQLLPAIILHALVDLQVAYVLRPIAETGIATAHAAPD
jgi:membrane protease YdiL (CAAX protease family)